MHKYIIIGGSDAGISAAIRIKEVQENSKVTVLLKDNYPNYSICGIPFFLSKEIKEWKSLAHRSKESIEDLGIEIMIGHEVTEIDLKRKLVISRLKNFGYDKILIATGAAAVVPQINGRGLPGVFTLRWIHDMLAIEQFILQKKVLNALIVGGGYIGIEMADAFRLRGLNVTLVEPSVTVLKTFDVGFGKKIESELQRNGVKICTNARVTEITNRNNRLLATIDDGSKIETDLIILATGVAPTALLLKNQGMAIGKYDAYKMNQQMESNITDVYVAGDCAETWHAILNDYLYLPLGTTAHKQGRIAGENMTGGKATFAGSLGTQVVKIFNMVAGRTGFHDGDCKFHKISSVTHESVQWDHKAYYPTAEKLTIRITGDPFTGKLLGMQIIGSKNAEVSKRLDIAATAIHNNLSVNQLNDLDLSYTPPLSSPWDPVQLAAQDWLKKTTTYGSQGKIINTVFK